MSPVLEVREPSARYLSATEPDLVPHLDLAARAVSGIARLREFVLTLAVQGKLVPQDRNDASAPAILAAIRAEKEALVVAGKLKREKLDPTMPDEATPFPLPAAWRWCRLGVVALKITDGTHHSPASFSTGEFKYLSAKNIKSWGIDLSDVTYVPPHVHHEIYSRCDPELGDVLYIKDGATTGVLTINTLPEQFSLLSSVAVIKPSCGLTTAYLAVVMRSPYFYRAMREGMTGVAITRVTLAKLNAALVPLPPLAEQARIVARVDELMRLCDALEEKGRLEAEQHARMLSALLRTLTDSATPEELAANWRRVAEHFDLLLDRAEAVDSLEQAILQLAVRGLLVPRDATEEPSRALLARLRAEEAADGPYELPTGWSWVPLGGIASVGTGTTPARENKYFWDSGSIPWVTSGETSQSFIRATEQFVTEEALAKTSLTLYAPGTLIVAMYGQGKTRGQVAELCLHATTNQACAAISLIEASPSHRSYIKLVFEKSYDEIRELSAGGAQPNLNVGKIRATLIPLPPLAEQARIVTRVTELRRLCTTLRQRLQAQQTTQSRLAEALVEQALA